jgi:hypothetical protein
MSEEKKKKKELFEGIVWKHCSIHNLDYPADSTCPKCSKKNR